ncbi:hypothetical protein AMTRI_Chr10g7950 [Amborella trichopoda]|uniref:RRM domain-containing protein n=1 Tax=Amborella trichopoda TaxID=13333 RepID=U5D9F0_AMBTC|nr:28 kDa ribonucleoprotein, chloroplastic [Amborella trichopoda]ERN19114.1 hypothetical protein AMTR_s00061p00142700 [Amborella trichopoda]|eukprot:XP_006857647.1 28 kDa ribonucleoprotein, chloroplastic [Amborella trichopoda]
MSVISVCKLNFCSISPIPNLPKTTPLTKTELSLSTFRNPTFAFSLRIHYLPHSLIPHKEKRNLFQSLIACVAQKTDWAQQEEENEIERSGFDWGQQEEETESTEKEEEGFVEKIGEEEEEYSEPPEEAKLFVGNLPYDLDSEKLAELFDKAGVVEIAEIIYNRETDQSRGFGFVTMSTVEEAEKAVETLHRYELNGRLLTVNKASARGSRMQSVGELEPSYKIYVGNLPWQVDDARLEQVFAEHGNVVDARVVYDRESGRSRGFGFVKMSTRSELDDVIAALDGQSLDGRSIRVNVAEERPRRSFV